MAKWNYMCREREMEWYQQRVMSLEVVEVYDTYSNYDKIEFNGRLKRQKYV